MNACSLGERLFLRKKRKEGDEGGGVGPEAVMSLHVEEMGNGVLVHAVLSIACKHGVPCHDVPHGHFGEHVGCRAEAGAPDVQVNEGSGDNYQGSGALLLNLDSGVVSFFCHRRLENQIHLDGIKLK